MNKFDWHQLFNYKYILAMLVFFVMIGFIGESSLINRIAQKREIAELKQKIKQQQDLFAEQKEELKDIRTNLKTVKRIAREKYYMKAQDEDVFVMKDEE